MQDWQATKLPHGPETDTSEKRVAQLSWLVSRAAQSSASLARELEMFAGTLSIAQITCPESTYRRLYDSTETLAHLLDAMSRNFAEVNENECGSTMPMLSGDLNAAIRSILVRGSVTTMAASTINTVSRE